jgi:hypothetical protein
MTYIFIRKRKDDLIHNHSQGNLCEDGGRDWNMNSNRCMKASNFPNLGG